MMQTLYAPDRAQVKPPACAPEGWQPPQRGYDDEDPRPETTQERQARAAARSMRERQWWQR